MGMGDQTIGFFNSLAFVLSIQLVGFGLAGFFRKFLVKPVSMYWPTTLANVALFVGFHEQQLQTSIDNGHQGMSRYSFLWVCIGSMFVYSLLPGYFMTTLQAVAILCFVTNNNVARFLGSATSFRGVGIGALTFDWNLIGGGYLTTPFWASLQFFVSNCIWTWIIVPAFYYSNFFQPRTLIHLPKGLPGNDTLNSYYIYDKNGTLLDPLDLMNPKTYDLNQTAYDAVAPIYITTFFASMMHFA
jgi:hypothetical protein